MNFLNSILKAFVGDKAQKDIKAVQPIIDQIKTFEATLGSLFHDELRSKTQEFKNSIREARAAIDEQINTLRGQIDTLTDIDEKEALYLQIDKLNDDAYQATEKALNDILPEAFAVIKETAKRFTNNPTIHVTATPFDRELSARFDFVTLEQDKAVWKNSWDAAGKEVTWDMIHYDVQLIGGITLHQGKIAEMHTGEGKTLVATLPVYLNALTGNGVHLVTVNDYLARRDSAWMGSLIPIPWIILLLILTITNPTQRPEEKHMKPISPMVPIMNLDLITFVIIWPIRQLI